MRRAIVATLLFAPLSFAVACVCSCSSSDTPPTESGGGTAAIESADASDDASEDTTPVQPLVDECSPNYPKCAFLGKYCYWPEGQCGPAEETRGRCISGATLAFCKDRPDNILCGCDGITYRNECEAQAARTSVKSRGPCP
jgi:hypothetical protein